MLRKISKFYVIKVQLVHDRMLINSIRVLLPMILNLTLEANENIITEEGLLCARAGIKVLSTGNLVYSQFLSFHLYSKEAGCVYVLLVF